jgi:hypothetical protein
MSTSIADENENTDRIDSEATKNEKNVHPQKVERRCDVELGRRVRHLCHLSRPGDGRLPSLSSGK